MNRAQFNRSEMINTVSDTMAENSNLWSGFPAIVAAVNDLNGKITALGTKIAAQGTPITGVAVDKGTARHDLEAKILFFGDQVAALAHANNDMTLAGQAHVTLSMMDVMADDDLENTAVRIKGLVVANAAALEDYGIVGDDVTEFGEAITEFHDMKTAPRTAVAGRKGQTDTLPDLLTDITSLLRNRLDKLMTRFRKDNPVFYGAYQSARVIVDKGNPAATKNPAPAKNPQ